jgi:hypothetical protein
MTMVTRRAGSALHGSDWPAHEVTRLEGFSDAVLAFAVTLLVVSLEVPRSFDELVDAMRGFLAFAICFALLVYYWYEHAKFFRRYGLQDALTTTLNAVFLFLVLFYVYPLKFLFTMVVNSMVFGSAAGTGGRALAISSAQIGKLFAVYGAGFAGVYIVLGLLYVRAYASRESLQLNAFQRFETRMSMVDHFAVASIGVLSVVLTLVTDASRGWPGWAYFLIPFVHTTTGFIRGRRARKLSALPRDVRAD